MSLHIGSPLFLMLLVCVPAVAVFGWRSLSGMSLDRRIAAIVLRSLVVALVVLALADLEKVITNDKLTVMFVLDRSESVPAARRRMCVDYYDKIRQGMGGDDYAGVVVFGKEARIELPTSQGIEMVDVETQVDPQHTDLGGALKLAMAAFPHDTAKRIVVISDGTQNRGEAREQAQMARANGIPIDVLPIRYEYGSEILVEKVVAPPILQKGEVANLRVVVASPVRAPGVLHLYQNRKPVHSKRVWVNPGKNVFEISARIVEPNFYTFTAEFRPDESAGDGLAQNNRASAFTYVKGQARVLLVTPKKSEAAHLRQALATENIEVTVRDRDDLAAMPASLAELQLFDTIIVSDMPAEDFTFRQMKMLEVYVRDLGGGLVMVGGPDSFGAGGWIGTPVERAMPVDMDIKAMKVYPRGALALVMHASEMARGNYWQKVVAKQAIQALSSRDYAGLITWNWRGRQAGQSGTTWLFPPQKVQNKTHLYKKIDGMTPGDMPSFDPGLKMAFTGLVKLQDAMVKHTIVISDGDPTPPSRGVVSQFAKSKITVTTVMVSGHGGATGLSTMKNLAKATGGRFYNVSNAKALPRIFIKEARMISRPIVYDEKPIRARLAYPTELIAGISVASMPPLLGYVLSTPKELAEVPLMADLPAKNPGPLLAHWRYGLGKTVAFTSDAGPRWAYHWVGWDQFSKFWAQILRWTVRSTDRGDFAVSTRVVDGQVRVIVDALNKDSEFLNFLAINGTVVSPEMDAKPLRLEQTAPGRYEGQCEAEKAGSYFLSLTCNEGRKEVGRLTAGVNVPYSAEYRQLRTNTALLEELASITDGRVMGPKEPFGAKDLFRRDLKRASSSESIWPWLLMAAYVLFCLDVAVRRIAIDWGRVREAVLGARREPKPAVESTQYMEALKASKQQAGAETPAEPAADADARFEPGAEPAEPGAEPETPSGEPGAPAPAAPPAAKSEPAAPEREDNYMDRLLKAKKKVWDKDH